MAPARRSARPAPARRRRGGARPRLCRASRGPRRDRARGPPPGARALAGRAVAPDLLAFFAEDSPSIAAPLIARSRLEPRGMAGAAAPAGAGGARPAAPPRGSRRRECKHALSAFGASDFVLESARSCRRRPADAAPEAEESELQIRELVARIEAFRRAARSRSAGRAARRRTARPKAFAGKPAPTASCAGSMGAPRGALVGQSIAAIAGPGQHGVDGQAAGAFEKRAPFRDARFSVAGERPRRRRLADFRRALLRCRAAAASRAIAAPPGGRGSTRSPRRPRRRPACSAPNSRPIRCAS